MSAVFWHWFVMWEPLIQGMFDGLKSGFRPTMGQSDSFSELVLLKGLFFFQCALAGHTAFSGFILDGDYQVLTYMIARVAFQSQDPQASSRRVRVDTMWSDNPHIL